MRQFLRICGHPGFPGLLALCCLLAFFSIPSIASAQTLSYASLSTGTKGLGLSLGQSSNGILGMAYYEPSESAIYYAELKSGTWVQERVKKFGTGVVSADLLGRTFYPNAALVYISEQPHILFADLTSGGLYHAFKTQQTWSVETIDASAKAFSISASACSLKICMSYYDASTRELRAGQGSQGLWSFATLESGVGSGVLNSLSITPEGRMAVAYNRTSTSEAVLAMSQPSGQWIFLTVPIPEHRPSFSPKIAIGSDGSVHMVISALPFELIPSAWKVFYARYQIATSDWSVGEFSDDYAGRMLDLRINADRPVIYYQWSPPENGSFPNVRFARSQLSESGLWSAKDVLPYAVPSVVRSSLAILSTAYSDALFVSLQSPVTLGRFAVELGLYASSSYLLSAKFGTNDTRDPSAVSQIPVTHVSGGGTGAGAGGGDPSVNTTAVINRVIDTDGDGIIDGQELIDGTDPLDKGSYKQTLGKQACAEWNGFLGGMFNILEQANLGTSQLNLTTVLYDSRGRARSETAISLAPGGQFDLLVHDLKGWELDGVGLICTSHDGQDGDLGGRIVYYKPESNSGSGSFQFAMAMPLSRGARGEQFAQFNTYQPSLSREDANNLVANWAQVTNLGSGIENGTLDFYGGDGSLLGSERISLAAYSRQDVSAHRFGPNIVGLMRWNPDNADSRFLVRMVRYLYSNPYLTDDFATAFELSAKAGSGRELFAPLDTSQGSAIVELSNTRSEKTNVDVRIYSEAGDNLLDTSFALEPYSSFHLITDQILQGGRGFVSIHGREFSSVLATAMHYVRTGRGQVDYMFGIEAVEALGFESSASYNTFLNQKSDLWIINTKGIAQEPQLAMARSQGENVISGKSLQLPANGVAVENIGLLEQTDRYGLVRLSHQTYGGSLAWVIRRKENQYAIPLLLE